MGVNSSTELSGSFKNVSTWRWSLVQSVIKSYKEGEYDFGIDYHVVMNITGFGMDEAKSLLAAHAKNDSGIINALTLLITLISLGDSNQRNELVRIQEIFTLFDFNNTSQITKDELTILFMCVSSSYAFILDNIANAPTDAHIIEATDNVYGQINKKAGQYITRDEFQAWACTNLFDHGFININSIFDRLQKSLEQIVELDVDAKKKK